METIYEILRTIDASRTCINFKSKESAEEYLVKNKLINTHYINPNMLFDNTMDYEFYLIDSRKSLFGDDECDCCQ